MHKVLVIVPFPMSDENLSKRQEQLKAVKLGPGIQFDFKAVRIAPVNYVSQQDALLADVGILEAGLSAQEQGYDAVCIDTVSDSGMAALRSVLTIPVIGAGRHAMLAAQMLGDRFSILSMWSRWDPLYKKMLADLGLSHKCASMRSPEMEPNNQKLLKGREDTVFPALHRVAMQCIEEDGADVIILGSTTMHETHAYLAEKLPVPVINPGPLSYRLAETALRLNLTHSKTAYPAPLAPRLDMFHAMGEHIAARP